jgi:hypothetical protein
MFHLSAFVVPTNLVQNTWQFEDECIVILQFTCFSTPSSHFPLYILKTKLLVGADMAINKGIISPKVFIRYHFCIKNLEGI